MIKYLLAVIAIISIGLTYYTYTNKAEVMHTDDKIVSKQKPILIQQDTSEEKVVIQQNAKEVAKKAVIRVKTKKVSANTEVTEELGKDLTLEEIESADVSDSDRERMLNWAAYNRTLDLAKEKKPSLTEEEFLDILGKELNHSRN